jgi:two-component system, chemotaxis family, chemotaxis protein CheY
MAMSVSVLVVDDSPMARKMLIRSLPPEWDVSIAQACSGVEALVAYRSGRIDVMFLDLTMPEMDGYQVLETLQREDMNCLVIVVSADIQERAQQRVRELGAIAFIKKPVDVKKVESVLRQYGIYV